MIINPLFFKKTDSSLLCSLCPNNCTIKEGKSGICNVRFNKGGEPEIPFAGKLSALASDPVEKKPLYHFFPGREILSAGFYGCSFRCPFCQNYSISAYTDDRAKTVTPEEMLSITEKSGTIGLAYTYSEPVVHVEWVSETAKLLREKGLKNVLVTNGYINREPGEYILENMDAANIDLKSFNPDFYIKEIKGKIEPVKSFIAFAAEKIHVEVTTLVITGKNDSVSEIESIAQFISSINRKIPLHLSCYFPAYNYTAPPTDAEKVLALAEAARKYLDFVYPGNIGYRESSTYCPSCRNLLIKRSGYRIEIKGITKDGFCSSCAKDTGVIS